MSADLGACVLYDILAVTLEEARSVQKAGIGFGPKDWFGSVPAFLYQFLESCARDVLRNYNFHFRVNRAISSLNLIMMLANSSR